MSCNLCEECNNEERKESIKRDKEVWDRKEKHLKEYEIKRCSALLPKIKELIDNHSDCNTVMEIEKLIRQFPEEKYDSDKNCPYWMHCYSGHNCSRCDNKTMKRAKKITRRMLKRRKMKK